MKTVAALKSEIESLQASIKHIEHSLQTARHELRVLECSEANKTLGTKLRAFADSLLAGDATISKKEISGYPGTLRQVTYEAQGPQGILTFQCHKDPT